MLLKKRRRKSQLLLKLSLQEKQIAEMRLYIEAMKEVLFEKRAFQNHFGSK